MHTRSSNENSGSVTSAVLSYAKKPEHSWDLINSADPVCQKTEENLQSAESDHERIGKSSIPTKETQMHGLSTYVDCGIMELIKVSSHGQQFDFVSNGNI